MVDLGDVILFSSLKFYENEIQSPIDTANNLWIAISEDGMYSKLNARVALVIVDVTLGTIKDGFDWSI